ncbi:MAG: DNA replication and repair protein RecF, partial [Pseudomonadota bacterium]
MILASLDVSDVRNLEHVTLVPAPGFNLFYGDNGAGKTSLLEAISILSTGRSFRAGKISTVIRADRDQLVISAQLKDAANTVAGSRIGIQRGRKETTVRIDGQNINRVSALAKALPCVIISTSNHELIERSPTERRSFVDWLLFHVEPGAHNLFQRYKNALQQRNAELKNNTSDELLAVWHPELVETGEQIDAGRRRILEKFGEKMEQVLDGWSESLKPSFQYRPGWPEDISLADALSRTDHCRRRGTTTAGPHRADILIRSGSQESRYVLSRGQQKLLAAQMRLVQIEMYTDEHQHSPVVLFDDLPSELDQN